MTLNVKGVEPVCIAPVRGYVVSVNCEWLYTCVRGRTRVCGSCSAREKGAVAQARRQLAQAVGSTEAGGTSLSRTAGRPETGHTTPPLSISIYLSLQCHPTCLLLTLRPLEFPLAYAPTLSLTPPSHLLSPTRTRPQHSTTLVLPTFTYPLSLTHSPSVALCPSLALSALSWAALGRTRPA